MSEASVQEPEVVELEPQRCAVVRESVPITGLPEFFGRAFGAVAAVAQAQARSTIGAPAAIYYGAPTDIADVAAGFPVDGPISAQDGVVEETLPGGPAVQLVHEGRYGSLHESYARLMEWMQTRGLTPGSLMWESYVNDPEGIAPEDIRTLIVWPVQA